MTIIINTNPSSQREQLIKFSQQLLNMEGACRDKFKKSKKKCSRMSVSNQVVSGVAVGSGTAGVVSALTVVGLPISIALASISVLGGITSGVLTTIGRSNQKSALNNQRKITILSQARIKLNIIIATTYQGNLISNEKVKEAFEIVNDALKKVQHLNLDEVSTMNLDVTEGELAYAEGLEALKDTLKEK